jgi:poly(3-hydroxybutyrate) depolymerase
VVADKEGFVVVTPQSTNDFVDGTDVPFIFKVEEMASAIMNVDPAKVFMTGVSNGGFFSYTAACDAKGSVFSGVSPVSGGNRSAKCPLSKPAPYIGFNAKTDEVIPYDNGVAGATLWEKTNHCKSGPTQTLTFGGPNTDTRELCLSSGPGLAPPFKLAACKASSSVSTCETWDGCDGDVKVTFCTVEGSKQLVGGHNLYFNDSKLSLAAVAWEFFKGTL